MDPLEDVTLVVEGINLKCSKRKLAQHSSYFKTMFEGNFVESNMDTIALNGVDVQSLKLCLLMLENRKFVPTDEYLDLVLQTACMLQFEEISECVRDKLLADLNVMNCLRVWFLIETYNLGSVSHKPKKMALVEFHTIKDQHDFLKLTKQQLHQYLANVHLICNEFDVFSAFMNWYYMNGGNVMDVLACLDFNRLSNEDIENMMSNIHASKSLALVNVLKCVLAVRKLEYVKNLHLSLNLALKVLDGNRRGSWIKPRFFEEVESEVEGIEDEEIEVAEDEDFWKALNLWMSEEKFNRKYRYILTGNKKQITLRRILIVSDTSFIVAWKYDCAEKHWNRKTNLHSNFSSNTLFFEIDDENNTGFSFVFSGDLPSTSENMECCYYKSQMFLLYNVIKRAFIYKPEDKYFFELKIVDEENFPTIKNKCRLYLVKDRVFVADSSQLVQLRVDEDVLLVEKVSALLPENEYLINDKSVLCHHPEYTVRMNKNLLTLESEMICRDEGVYRIGTLQYVYDTTCEMLWPDDHKLSGRDEYVNTIENLFGESSNRC